MIADTSRLATEAPGYEAYSPRTCPEVAAARRSAMLITLGGAFSSRRIARWAFTVVASNLIVMCATPPGGLFTRGFHIGDLTNSPGPRSQVVLSSPATPESPRGKSHARQHFVACPQ